MLAAVVVTVPFRTQPVLASWLCIWPEPLIDTTAPVVPSVELPLIAVRDEPLSDSVSNDSDQVPLTELPPSVVKATSAVIEPPPVTVPLRVPRPCVEPSPNVLPKSAYTPKVPAMAAPDTCTLPTNWTPSLRMKSACPAELISAVIVSPLTESVPLHTPVAEALVGVLEVALPASERAWEPALSTVATAMPHSSTPSRRITERPPSGCLGLVTELLRLVPRCG